MREVQDHYFREAKREGYLSRAAYKLIEIDDRKKVLQPGDAVLDCGAAPGSWLQVAAKRVGPRGIVVGVDLQPMRGAFAANVRTIESDFTTITADELLRAAGDVRAIERFDVVLSDMAPNTTGDRNIDHFGSARLCHAVLDRCGELLKSGGNCVIKVLEGESYPELLQRARELFDAVKGFKPAASRSQSTEIYVVAHGLRASASKTSPQQAAHPPAPRGGPSRGWGDQARRLP